MKITPEDMDAVRSVLTRYQAYSHYDEQRDIALALILVRIYDRGYAEGYDEGIRSNVSRDASDSDECPFTHSHTRHWCGYSTCRDS